MRPTFLPCVSSVRTSRCGIVPGITFMGAVGNVPASTWSTSPILPLGGSRKLKPIHVSPRLLRAARSYRSQFFCCGARIALRKMMLRRDYEGGNCAYQFSRIAASQHCSAHPRSFPYHDRPPTS
ncbi:hypothetical protein K466DRAFT_65975 [Polyporus arcularius HHB13444]|uniref:Uncharacterized protein n=1 Tax=Polyporus arcularius HHB13444 TaxID=1314778 RepID=A0A5C3PG87_9APHY|nr:hypothetical protein K466DRAFT_65975 [Polyporus arcularius HHB13444]